ncbi:MAG: hypothetical protein Q8P15_02325, partial [Nanoarchaeota archaeon]|nr:hypothetical protein [Nanoarchaeota archaeon]
MAYVDEFGVAHSVDNSFPILLKRMITSIEGILGLFLPLIILIGIFFIIKRYHKKYLLIYS